MSDPQEAATPSDPHSAEALDLDAIQKRADAATGGPWLPDERHVLKPDKPESTWDGTVIASVPDDEFGLYEFGNTEFIAHARTDVPALVAAVRSRDAEVAELRAEKERWHDAALIGLAQESAARSEVAELKAKIAELTQEVQDADSAIAEAIVRGW